MADNKDTPIIIISPNKPAKPQAIYTQDNNTDERYKPLNERTDTTQTTDIDKTTA